MSTCFWKVKLLIIHCQLSVKGLMEFYFIGKLLPFSFSTSFFWRLRIKWFRFWTSCVPKGFEYYDLVRLFFIFLFFKRKVQYKEARAQHLHNKRFCRTENKINKWRFMKKKNSKILRWMDSKSFFKQVKLA